MFLFGSILFFIIILVTLQTDGSVTFFIDPPSLLLYISLNVAILLATRSVKSFWWGGCQRRHL